MFAFSKRMMLTSHHHYTKQLYDIQQIQDFLRGYCELNKQVYNCKKKSSVLYVCQHEEEISNTRAKKLIKEPETKIIALL